MILKKRVIGICLLLCLVVGISMIKAPDRLAKETLVKANTKPQIIIDAGHGGFDGGAVAGDGTVEKDINLEIATTLSHFLKLDGYNVIMTRESDVSTDDVETDKISARKKSDLKNRLELMEDYEDAIFVSIHLNKFTTSSAKGAQIFYSPRIEKSKLLGEEIRKSVVGLLQPENTRVNKQATSSTYILYNATIPCVLVECGFLSNNSELELLKQEDYQNKMAFSIYCGITNFFKENKNVT